MPHSSTLRDSLRTGSKSLRGERQSRVSDRVSSYPGTKGWSNDEVAHRQGRLFPPGANHARRRPVSEGWIQPRLNDARWAMKARERLQRLSWFMHRLKEPLSLGRQGRHPRRPRDRRGQADRLSACRSGITGSTASDRRRRDLEQSNATIRQLLKFA